jgi:hypothetical protein
LGTDHTPGKFGIFAFLLPLSGAANQLISLAQFIEEQGDYCHVGAGCCRAASALRADAHFFVDNV